MAVRTRSAPILALIFFPACIGGLAAPHGDSSIDTTSTSGDMTGDTTGTGNQQSQNPAPSGSTGPTGPTGPAASTGTPKSVNDHVPAGWLYTQAGKIYVSDGTGGTQWMARGVNIDDLFLCGGGTPSADSETKLHNIVADVITDWKAQLIRVSLSMNSHGAESWLSNDARYKTPMTNVIKFAGSHPGVYVLVTLRSDTTMVETDSGNEATFIPTNNTDAVFRALVDSFADQPYVLFGLSNEPGTPDAGDLATTMTHAASVIRAEEDKLGTPHHLISVQGRGWTQDISYYATHALTQDNIVYEYHHYPQNGTGPSNYTYANLPVIIGEYGMDVSLLPAFYADVEAKKIPNLAWDYEPFSNCYPDLVDAGSNPLSVSTWGTPVKAYLTSH